MNASRLPVANQNLLAEIKTRGMIIIFMFLVCKLNKIIAHLVDDQAVKLIVYSLLDLVAVIILPFFLQIKELPETPTS